MVVLPLVLRGHALSHVAFAAFPIKKRIDIEPTRFAYPRVVLFALVVFLHNAVYDGRHNANDDGSNERATKTVK